MTPTRAREGKVHAASRAKSAPVRDGTSTTAQGNFHGAAATGHRHLKPLQDSFTAHASGTSETAPVNFHGANPAAGALEQHGLGRKSFVHRPDASRGEPQIHTRAVKFTRGEPQIHTRPRKFTRKSKAKY